MTEAAHRCLICDHQSETSPAAESGQVRGNTERFKSAMFTLWKCPECLSIHSVAPVDMADIYSDYPLNQARTLDVFARGTFRNLLGRLTRHGLSKSDHILDYGCGNGVYVQFLQGLGFTNAHGYDPFVDEYSELPPMPANGFDCVIANDVIEHVDCPKTMMTDCMKLVKPGGLLYVGTADSEAVTDMANLDSHIMRLHQPFHRVILTQSRLIQLGLDIGLEKVETHRRSYMDTLMPFSNYRFLDEFNKAHGHILDNALAPDAAGIVMRKPQLLWYALFGYFMPSAIEPAVLWRVPVE